MAECDSAGAAGGDASGGVGAADVLGGCDHSSGGESGYLGDGCFHVPSQCEVPFHRWEIGNGGSKRKKTKNGKDKKYAYEKGMKVVCDMLHEEDQEDSKQLDERKMTRAELDGFYDALKAGEVEFDFIKKDGSRRHARGTLNPDLMPSRAEIENIYSEQGIDLAELEAKLQARKDYMPFFWDLENNGYRQFHVSRFEGVTNDAHLSEVQHDGLHIPSHPTRRNQVDDKPTIYYIGVDYSENFSNYGQYVMPNGALTVDASNNQFKNAATTRVPETALKMAKNAAARYGKKMNVFLFKEEYSYGVQTHKRHARPSVADIWYPDGQYWKYGLSSLGA